MMTNRAIHAVAILHGLALAAIVITAAGYYQSLALLVMQIAFIAGPSAAPLLLIGNGWARWRVAGLLGTAVLLAAGWGYVVYVDTRPYVGGGASMAIVLGWMTCVALTIAALIPALIGRYWAADRDPRWSRPARGRSRSAEE